MMRALSSHQNALSGSYLAGQRDPKVEIRDSLANTQSATGPTAKKGKWKMETGETPSRCGKKKSKAINPTNGEAS